MDENNNYNGAADGGNEEERIPYLNKDAEGVSVNEPAEAENGAGQPQGGQQWQQPQVGQQWQQPQAGQQWQQPQAGQQWQQPQGGSFVDFADGTRRFVPNGATFYEPPKKKKRGGLIAAAVTAGVLVVALIVGLSFYGVDRALDGSDVSGGMPQTGVLSAAADGSAASQEDVSVPEIVNVAPVPDESYESLAELYKRCSKSCVTIICDIEVNNGFYTQKGQSLGSGFIVEGEKDGVKGFYIVTNHHVIDSAKSITVKYYDGKTYEAKLLGSDELCDIAVLSTDRTDVSPIALGDSSQLAVGQWVVAIGTPAAEEFQNTMSYGIISGLNREVPVTNDIGDVIKTMTVIQTTATLNSGNSGGPLINMAGQVVGINAMKLMENYEGMGFALPSSEASAIINSLIEYGKVVDVGGGYVSATAQLGITGATVTDSVRKNYSLGDCPDGVLVVNVNRGTSVYEAGLSIFDIITEFNGEDVDSIEELKELISNCKAGDSVTITFYRLGRLGEQSEYRTISFRLDSAS